jgi:hypothetical protein
MKGITMAGNDRQPPTERELVGVRFRESLFLGGELSTTNNLEVGQRNLQGLEVSYQRRVVVVRFRMKLNESVATVEREIPFELIGSILWRRL